MALLHVNMTVDLESKYDVVALFSSSRQNFELSYVRFRKKYVKADNIFDDKT